jgi:hypothetical protein
MLEFDSSLERATGVTRLIKPARSNVERAVIPCEFKTLVLSAVAANADIKFGDERTLITSIPSWCLGSVLPENIGCPM